MNNQTREELLQSILDPSARIAAAYTNYAVFMKNGRVMSGLLVGETTKALTLRGEVQDVTLLREGIESIRASSVSLMPDGLEQEISIADAADLISYLRAGL